MSAEEPDEATDVEGGINDEDAINDLSTVGVFDTYRSTSFPVSTSNLEDVGILSDTVNISMRLTFENPQPNPGEVFTAQLTAIGST